jgi:hypothetical protein
VGEISKQRFSREERRNRRERGVAIGVAIGVGFGVEAWRETHLSVLDIPCASSFGLAPPNDPTRGSPIRMVCIEEQHERLNR